MQFNPALAKEARKVLDVNKSERHIRGGLATREKYLHQHEIGIKYVRIRSRNERQKSSCYEIQNRQGTKDVI